MVTRLSTAGFHRNTINAILDSQSKMAKTQTQITTGKRFQTASEDPIAATRASALDRTLADNAQYERNSSIVESRLSYEEQTLADVTTVLQQVRERALQGANTTLGAEERKMLANDIRQNLAALMDLANADDSNGEYLFAGLPPGRYRVRLAPPPGYALTSARDGYAVTLAGGQAFLADFTASAVGSITGRVVRDRNGDGVLTPDEPGLTGVDVYLDQNGNGVFDQTTASYSSAGPVSVPAGASGSKMRTGCSRPTTRIWSTSRNSTSLRASWAVRSSTRISVP